MTVTNGPKILFLDIETAPQLSYHWGRWNQNISQKQVVEEGFLLCYAYKWLGDRKKAKVRGLDDIPVKNEEQVLVEELWDLIDEADIVVGHYVKRFDLPEIFRRFAFYDMKPPSPVRAICTKEQAKKHFRFQSNRLGDLGEFLGLGGKLSHEGFELWRGCLEWDPKSWKTMKAYNQRDVDLLEKVYLRLRPYMTTHPNLGAYKHTHEASCPKCGSENLQARGYATTQLGRFQRFVCNDCGGWGRVATSDMSKEQKASQMRNIPHLV